MAETELICVGCPLGCCVTLLVSDKGEIESLTGHTCKEGKGYVIAEYRAPLRVFTATIRTTGGRLLPVRTDKPVGKGRLQELMQALANVRLNLPVEKGEVIIHNFLGTGANLVATAACRNIDMH